MKELIIEKTDIVKVYVYEHGKVIDSYELKVNVNNILCTNRIKK